MTQCTLTSRRPLVPVDMSVCHRNINSCPSPPRQQFVHMCLCNCVLNQLRRGDKGVAHVLAKKWGDHAAPMPPPMYIHTHLFSLSRSCSFHFLSTLFSLLPSLHMVFHTLVHSFLDLSTNDRMWLADQGLSRVHEAGAGMQKHVYVCTLQQY